MIRQNSEIKLNQRNKANSLFIRIMVAMTMLMLSVTPCFAATNYVKSAADSLLVNVTWMCVVGTIVIAVICAIKKETAKMVIVILIGALISFISANPNAIINIGNTVGKAFNFV